MNKILFARYRALFNNKFLKLLLNGDIEIKSNTSAVLVAMANIMLSLKGNKEIVNNTYTSNKQLPAVPIDVHAKNNIVIDDILRDRPAVATQANNVIDTIFDPLTHNIPAVSTQIYETIDNNTSVKIYQIGGVIASSNIQMNSDTIANAYVYPITLIIIRSDKVEIKNNTDSTGYSFNAIEVSNKTVIQEDAINIKSGAYKVILGSATNIDHFINDDSIGSTPKILQGGGKFSISPNIVSLAGSPRYGAAISKINVDNNTDANMDIITILMMNSEAENKSNTLSSMQSCKILLLGGDGVNNDKSNAIIETAQILQLFTDLIIDNNSSANTEVFSANNFISNDENNINLLGIIKNSETSAYIANEKIDVNVSVNAASHNALNSKSNNKIDNNTKANMLIWHLPIHTEDNLYIRQSKTAFKYATKNGNELEVF